jgi:hypothetical protein
VQIVWLEGLAAQQQPGYSGQKEVNHIV